MKQQLQLGPRELGNSVLRYTEHSNPFYLDTCECCCRQQRSSEAGLAVSGNATRSKHKCKGFKDEFVPRISSHWFQKNIRHST